jgi:hypothetical protein
MKKLYFSDVIEKYHLGGLVERVKISVKDKTLETKFIATNKNLIGFLTAPNVDLEDCEFGVYDTSQLLKLIGITDALLKLSIEKQGKVSNKLLIADAEYNLEYALADTMLTPTIPAFDEPQYEMEALINREFIDKFVKAKKALTSEIFTISSGADSLGNNALLFNLGGTEGYTNKINFHIPAVKTTVIGTPVKFALEEFNEILLANKDLKSGILYVSEQGLLKINFENEEGVKISYVLVGKE